MCENNKIQNCICRPFRNFIAVIMVPYKIIIHTWKQIISTFDYFNARKNRLYYRYK